MKISQLIQELQAIQAKKGDLDCYSYDSYSGLYSNLGKPSIEFLKTDSGDIERSYFKDDPLRTTGVVLE